MTMYSSSNTLLRHYLGRFDQDEDVPTQQDDEYTTHIASPFSAYTEAKKEKDEEENPEKETEIPAEEPEDEEAPPEEVAPEEAGGEEAPSLEADPEEPPPEEGGPEEVPGEEVAPGEPAGMPGGEEAGMDPGMGGEAGMDAGMGGMPGEEDLAPKSPEEVSKMYDLKKIHARLVSIQSYLAITTEPELIELRNYVGKSIELFSSLISNSDLFKDKLNKIIKTFYKFLDEVYSTLSKHFKKKEQEEQKEKKEN